MKALLSQALPSKGAVARTLLAPVVRSTVQDWLTDEPQDQVRLQHDSTGNEAEEESLVARAAGVVAGTATGLATTVVCAAKYPISAVVVGTTTTVVVMKTQTALPLPERTVCALAAGGLAAVYAPAVAGAVVAVATEEMVTDKVDKFLKSRAQEENS